MAATVAPNTHTMHNAAGEPLFTCLSCSIAFLTAEDQRGHYRSDHHRYNMKRRVANLPPVSASVFNQKVLDRRAETAVTISAKDTTCEICKKVYGSEGAFKAHLSSKKHKETELQAAIALSLKQNRDPAAEENKSDEVPSYQAPQTHEVPSAPEAVVQPPSTSADAANASPSNAEDATMEVDESDEVEQTLEQKLAASRMHLTPQSCLFCPVVSPSVPQNLEHMSTRHGFFLPDADYLTDLPGLLGYLGEKIAVGNVCLYCNGRGRGFHSMEAVRKHMIDKSHCKLAYDTEDDRMEVGEWYDFEKSYPRKAKKGSKRKVEVVDEEDEEMDDGDVVEGEWEDVSDDGEEADELIEEVVSGSEDSDDSDDDRQRITFGDSPYELVLPSGARIGHRSLKRYYDQSFSFRAPAKPSDPNSGAALVRRLVGDRNNQLVPMKGGFGAFGAGTDVVKARNVGEAREAGRHVREFRDMKRREQFKTKIGFRNNAQKHFRDPLLQ